MVFLLLFKKLPFFHPFSFSHTRWLFIVFLRFFFIEKERLISFGVVSVGGGGIVFVLHLNFSEYYRSTSLQN